MSIYSPHSREHHTVVAVRNGSGATEVYTSTPGLGCGHHSIHCLVWDCPLDAKPGHTTSLPRSCSYQLSKHSSSRLVRTVTSGLFHHFSFFLLSEFTVSFYSISSWCSLDISRKMHEGNDKCLQKFGRRL